MTIHSTGARGVDDGGATKRTFDKIVHHGGRNFLATGVMAAIFSARAEDVIARNDTELVPLLHREGVDLLLVGPDTVFAVVNVGVGIGSHRSSSLRPKSRNPKSTPATPSRIDNPTGEVPL